MKAIKKAVDDEVYWWNFKIHVGKYTKNWADMSAEIDVVVNSSRQYQQFRCRVNQTLRKKQGRWEVPFSPNELPHINCKKVSRFN